MQKKTLNINIAFHSYKNVDLLVIWYVNTLERLSFIKITYKK